MKKEEKKEKMNRLMDLKILTKNYSRIKMDITWLSEDIKDHDVYIEGQEILSEMDREVWKYINGETLNY